LQKISDLQKKTTHPVFQYVGWDVCKKDYEKEGTIAWVEKVVC
jgi:hypothetical protein